jgi:predicted amidohydrolase
MRRGAHVRAAAVQLQSTDDKDRNLRVAADLTRAAAADGARLVVLPERLDIRGASADYARGAEPLDGRPVSWARELARELGIDLVAGSVAERRDSHRRAANTSVHVGPDGEVKAVYRKIHMFDVEVGGVEYRESEHSEPADEIVLSETADGVELGLTICYDLRFPELYRILALRGARIVTIPSNFTKVTGEAHWEVLVRARAIENQAFVIAPGQAGRQPPDGESYGNSMIVDPWGVVLARAAGEGECFVAAELDLARQDEVREKLPSLANRVPAAYRWPEEAAAAQGVEEAAAEEAAAEEIRRQEIRA